MESLIKFVQDEFVTKKEIPSFKSGDTITVYYEIREGEKVRTQFFKGTVIQIKGEGLSKTFTIRKMSGTVGVERIFPINLPTLEKIEVNKRIIRSENMDQKDIQSSNGYNQFYYNLIRGKPIKALPSIKHKLECSYSYAKGNQASPVEF